MSSVYVGFVLTSPITNQKRYEAVLNEILSYLTTKQEHLTIQQVQNIKDSRVQPNRFFTFFSKKGSICEQVSLPFSPLFLHTSYFRLHQGFHLDEQDRQFAAICWEVLHILKENFPSKVLLHQENLELCQEGGTGCYMLMSHQEELRRQTSCLMSMRDEGRPLTMDEVEDAWQTLVSAERIGDVKAQNTCLDILNSLVPLQFWELLKIETDTLVRIAEKGGPGQLSQNKFLAADILQKLSQDKENEQVTGNQTLQRQLNEISQNEEDSMLQSDTKQFSVSSTIDRPTSTRMCLFQLSESNDLTRVTILLETLSLKPKETLQQLRKKHNLSQKTIQVVKKYCNGDYGFETQQARKGYFQRNLLNLLIILSQDYVVFFEYLQSQALDYLCQILEEAVIFAYEDAMQGHACQNMALVSFMVGALDFVDLAVSKQFMEYVQKIQQMLMTIQARLAKMITKRENALLQYFIQQYSYETPIQKESEQEMYASNLDVEQLNQLKAISQNLYCFAQKLNDQIQRIEALQEFSEKYEEKHSRLFYQIVGVQQLPQHL